MARRGIAVPREHGAWAMLIMPYVVGVGVAGHLALEAILFLLAAVSLFSGRHAVALAVRDRHQRQDGRRNVMVSLALYGLIGSLSGLALLVIFQRWALVPIAALALFFISIQSVLQRNRLDRTIGGELLAFAGLALTAPGVLYVSTGELDLVAGSVWLLTFLYAGAGVFYVKLKVRQRVLRAQSLGMQDRWRLALGALGYLCALAIVLSLSISLGFAPLGVLVAFCPLAVKMLHDTVRVTPSLNLRRLGLIEVGHAVAFSVLLIAAYSMS